MSQSHMRTLTLLLALSLASMAQAGTEGFDRLDAVIDSEIRNKNLPMVSAILVDEEGVVWEYGASNESHSHRVEPGSDTTWRIGSVSKLFTDIAVMQLVEQEKLDLDEPVQTYLPDFRPENPFGEPITLRLLMSHSSGLVREPPIGNYFDAEVPSLAATVRSLNETELVYAPGSKVQYSNAGIAVVGRVVEAVAGTPFAAVLEARILDRLGMSGSSFEPRPAIVRNLPEAYMWSYQGDRVKAPTFELGMAPAGSMYSTMNDLALFMNALIARGEGVNGRILEARTLEKMWTPQTEIESARNRSFGIGFSLGELDGEKTVSHGGAIYGFATQLKVLPERGIGVAIATNLDMANGAVNRIADFALRTLLASKDGEALPEFHVSKPMPELTADGLVGLYRGSSETIEVKRRLGELYIERVNGLALRLRSIDNRIVIDDIMAFSEDIEFSDGAVTVFGREYESFDRQKPDPVEPSWSELLGEYGYDHNILYISEKYGKLHALIEWGTQYPLEQVGDDRFKLPSYGLYPNEHLVFERNKEGEVILVSLSGVDFERRPVGDIDGGVFRIDPVRPVPELRREALQASPPKEPGPFREADLVDIREYSDTLKMDIRYASDDNFLGVPVYPSAEAFLQRPAAEALGRVSDALEQQGYGLMVHDAYRPWFVTKLFWDATPVESHDFVADPSEGSRHNRGCAIDLTLYDLETGEPIRMVGVYDEFSPRSYPHYPGGTSLQRWHRELLRQAMESEGFNVYEYEWWHFDYDGWENYAIQTQTFDALR